MIALLSLPASLLAATFDNAEDVVASTSLRTKTGAKIPLDLQFTDQNGKPQTFGKLLADGKPVVLLPVYYRCPSLGTLTLRGLLEAVNQSDLVLGRDYRAVTYSINPDEGPDLARKKAD